MSDPQTLRRSSHGRRQRSPWKRLPLVMDDAPSVVKPAQPRRAVSTQEAAEPAERPTPPPIFHPLAYRGVVAGWSIESRELWGRRANELEDAGLSWRDAETQAFVEVWRMLRAASVGQ